MEERRKREGCRQTAHAVGIRHSRAPAPHLTSVRALVPGDTREFEERIRAIRVPALLIGGAKDRAVPLALGCRLADQLPHATLVELEAGHVPNQEAPNEVLEHLRRFLLR